MIPILTASLVLRNDSVGQGHFGASRGGRKHNGIDYLASPGTQILSPITGICNKLGYPYSDDLSYRYVQVACKRGDHTHNHRFFYVEPLVKVGESVEKGQVIGIVQDISERYGDSCMPHVHWEIKQGSDYLDPEGLGYV